MRFRSIFHFKELLHTRKSNKLTKAWTDEDWVLASLAVYVNVELTSSLRGKQANPHKLDRKYIAAFLKLIGAPKDKLVHYTNVFEIAMTLKEEGRLPMTSHIIRFNWINLSSSSNDHSKIILWKDTDIILANTIIYAFRVLSNIRGIEIGGVKREISIFAIRFIELLWFMHRGTRKHYRAVAVIAMNLEIKGYLPK